jgi:hypothetical protein
MEENNLLEDNNDVEENDVVEEDGAEVENKVKRKRKAYSIKSKKECIDLGENCIENSTIRQVKEGPHRSAAI